MWDGKPLETMKTSASGALAALQRQQLLTVIQSTEGGKKVSETPAIAFHLFFLFLLNDSRSLARVHRSVALPPFLSPAPSVAERARFGAVDAKNSGGADEDKQTARSFSPFLLFRHRPRPSHQNSTFLLPLSPLENVKRKRQLVSTQWRSRRIPSRNDVLDLRQAKDARR